MGDGENATPDHPTPERQSDADNNWLTRSAPPMPGATPWERAAAARPAYAGQLPGADETADDAVEPSSGNHTAGVSVADLIARVTGEIPVALLDAAADDPPVQSWPEDVDPPTNRTAAVPAPLLPDLNASRVDRQPAVSGRRVWPHPFRHRSTMVAGRIVAAIMAVLALVLTGAAWQWTTAKNNLLNNVAALDPDSRDILDPNAQFGDENFLIVGVDSRIGQNADMGAGSTDGSDGVVGARSDTIMLVNIPAGRERVVAVSFPRDTAITPFKCDAWDARTGEYGPIYDEVSGTYSDSERYTETKLNSAYSLGGPKCLVKAIQKISGLSVNRFMAIDFAGFSKMVDALGGVEVCSTTPLQDYELGTVLPTAGRQVISGHTALNYVRARQVTTEVNGDYGRIKRQQMFLSSLLRSLISKDTFFSLSKLNNVVNMFINDSYVDNVQTKDLVELGQSIQGVSAGRVSFVTLPTSGITDDNGNEVRDTTADRALFDAIINDEALPGENDLNETTVPVTTNSAASAMDSTGTTTATTSPTPSTTAAASGAHSVDSTETVNAVTTDPQDVTVHVSNATEQVGLGSAATTSLQMHGFVVDTPDDHAQTLESTTVFFSSGNEEAAATVAAALGSPRLEQVSGIGSTVRVALGSDFYSVGAPLPSGSSVSLQVVHSTDSTPTPLPEDLTVTNGADISCE
jgi:LCP family protein required for cell wall assembly